MTPLSFSMNSIFKPVVKVGKVFKRLHRQFKRRVRFGSKGYTKNINLLNTNFKIVINPSQNACVDETIAIQGYWEKELSEQIAHFITPHSIFIDIGANIGYHSLFVASLLKNSGQVYCFEPLPKLAQQIRDSVTVNGFTNVVVHTVGLGKKSYEAPIYVRDENMGGSSLSPYQNLNLVNISSTETIKVVTLDSVLSPTTPVTVIKIDVEGYEFEALQGARELLAAQHPVIFMEFSPLFYNQDYPSKSTDLIAFLVGLGYSFETMERTPIDLIEWLRTTPDATQIDVICLPNSNRN